MLNQVAKFKDYQDYSPVPTQVCAWCLGFVHRDCFYAGRLNGQETNCHAASSWGSVTHSDSHFAKQEFLNHPKKSMVLADISHSQFYPPRNLLKEITCSYIDCYHRREILPRAEKDGLSPWIVGQDTKNKQHGKSPPNRTPEKGKNQQSKKSFFYPPLKFQNICPDCRQLSLRGANTNTF